MSSDKIEEILVELVQERGYRVEKDRGIPQGQEVTIIEEVGEKETVRLGVTCCEHLCSKYQQLTALHDFYRYAESRGVQAFLSLGDTVDGGRMHPDQEYELFVHGASGQLAYAAAHFPKASVPIYKLDGNHDYSAYKTAGVIFGQELEKRRPDIKFLGYASATVRVGPASIYLMHGSGGVPYARSYRLQRVAEQLDLERRGHHVFLLGHYHVSCVLPRYQNLACAMVPCFQAQTPYLRRLGLEPEIGGLVLELEFVGGALRAVRTDWRFYEPKDHDF